MSIFKINIVSKYLIIASVMFMIIGLALTYIGNELWRAFAFMFAIILFGGAIFIDVKVKIIQAKRKMKERMRKHGIY